MVGILMHLILSQISLRVSSVLFLLFTLFCSLAVISSILPSSLLILSSASDSLLLTYFRVFLISVVMLFISVSLFFSSSRDFFFNSCTFSILFSKWSFYYHFFFWILLQKYIFLLHFLDFCVIPHLRGISLTFHYLFNFFCFSSLYPGFKVQFFLPFVLRSFQCFEYGSSRWDMWCFILWLFFLWWARLSNVAVLSTDDWVFIFVLFVCFLS